MRVYAGIIGPIRNGEMIEKNKTDGIPRSRINDVCYLEVDRLGGLVRRGEQRSLLMHPDFEFGNQRPGSFPAKPRGIGWDGAAASVMASQSRQENFRGRAR